MQRIAVRISVLIVISGFAIDARDYQAGRPRLTVGPNSPQTSIRSGIVADGMDFEQAQFLQV
jgi:hypothetical protein